MKKSLAQGAGVLLLAATIGGVALFRQGAPDRSRPEASRALTGKRDDAEGRARRGEIDAVSPSYSLDAPPPALSVGRHEMSPEDANSSSANPAAPRGSESRNVGADAAQLAHRASDDAAGESVEVGRPFPIPPSVKDSCEKGPRHVCDLVLPVIYKMGDERRDLAWAPAAELRLLGLLGTAPGRFTVRAIECRTTLCVAEVASPDGLHPGIGGYQVQMDNGFYDKGVLTGYEESEPGIKVTVRLFVYERREHRLKSTPRD